MRAAFKAVMDGTQVAVLVPTTLLAEQHFLTFSERFRPFPVTVKMLSRFVAPAEQQEVLRDLAAGKVDVVIGTHRLLGKDVAFANLGLLVVDEEQRFGVAHKERMKTLRAHVDVLTMTATPIPRTLEMALTGIRQMSTIDTPPEDRQPVLTFVGSFDEDLALGAVRRELLREGQIFWVHNRVATIDRQVHRLRQALPDARIALGHGQMDEELLEREMVRFWEREADVLVCTTIIESGLDVPNANTLIVDRADMLGLAQLYQLRGRVGRAGERAFAYLFFPAQREMTEEAHARLATIAQHQALGSGFQIAMRDLEIRGAGNLLGAEQSGHIAAVGFDAYARILQESVQELRGTPIEPERDLRIDLPVKAFVPPGWIGQESLRLELYRRISMAGDHDALADDPRRDGRPFRRVARAGRGAVRDRVAPARRPPRSGSARSPRSRSRSDLSPVALAEAAARGPRRTRAGRARSTRRSRRSTCGRTVCSGSTWSDGSRPACARRCGMGPPRRLAVCPHRPIGSPLRSCCSRLAASHGRERRRATASPGPRSPTRTSRAPPQVFRSLSALTGDALRQPPRARATPRGGVQPVLPRRLDRVLGRRGLRGGPTSLEVTDAEVTETADSSPRASARGRSRQRSRRRASPTTRSSTSSAARCSSARWP